MRTLRADARRSREQIVQAAETAFRRYGADASLEAIAKDAGVGSATLHRHFRSRRQLAEAVFQERTEAVAAVADRLKAEREPGPALVHWLRAALEYAVANRGLVMTLLPPSDEDTATKVCGHQILAAAADSLLSAAQAAGAVRADVTVADTLALVNAMSLLAEQDATADVHHLLELAITGIGPSPSGPGSSRPAAGEMPRT
ncbi:TetR/AcrR family transcriptional regulator [Amycolatopsis sp. NPDC059021]|uniref:TetR/AcrR family transcriptional regulator n=1 Tax=Amycolatopsis sp. NPDC059021 TaxID=3346704 RepID=UPI003671982E